MHTGPMPESAGEFQPPAKKLYDCRYCAGTGCVEMRLWESSCGGYDDEKYTCQKCGKTWWIEGADG